MKFLYICSFLTSLMVACHQQKTLYDISIYDNTDVEKLALYVANEDTLNIHRLIAENKGLNIDSPDPILGKSLLMWSIFNGKYNSFAALLKQKANPNFVSKKDGKTPLIMSVNYVNNDYMPDDRFLKDLLSYGANPQLITCDSVNHVYVNPIYEASIHLQYIKDLIEICGVDPNYSLDGVSIVEVAVIQEKLDVLHYLVVEKNAKIDGVTKTFGKYKRPLIDFVKDWKYPIGSKEYKMKNDILKSYNRQIRKSNVK